MPPLTLTGVMIRLTERVLTHGFEYPNHFRGEDIPVSYHILLSRAANHTLVP